MALTSAPGASQPLARLGRGPVWLGRLMPDDQMDGRAVVGTFDSVAALVIRDHSTSPVAVLGSPTVTLLQGLEAELIWGEHCRYECQPAGPTATSKAAKRRGRAVAQPSGCRELAGCPSRCPRPRRTGLLSPRWSGTRGRSPSGFATTAARPTPLRSAPAATRAGPAAEGHRARRRAMTAPDQAGDPSPCRPRTAGRSAQSDGYGAESY